MSRLNFKNNSYTTLAASITATQDSFVVADASALPEVPFKLTILDSSLRGGSSVEIIEVGAKNNGTNTLSDVLRGQEGTTGVIHASGVRVENRLTAGGIGETVKKDDLPYNVMDYGVVADGVTNDSTAIQALVNAISEGTIYFPDGEYSLENGILISGKSISLKFSENAVILFDGSVATNKSCFKFQGSSGSTEAITANVAVGGTALTVASSTGFSAGDLVYVASNEESSTNAREYDTKREFHRVSSVAAGQINLVEGLYFAHTTANTPTVNVVNTLKNIRVSGGVLQEVSPGIPATESIGIHFDRCENFSVVGVTTKDFDYTGINAATSYHGKIAHCTFRNDYSDTLQYGCIVFASSHVIIDSCNSECTRTSIDVTRLSRFITIANCVISRGSVNTHTSFDVKIINNQLLRSRIILRGTGSYLSGNLIVHPTSPCLDVQEAGLEGSHVVVNNEFRGMFGYKLIANHSKFNGNKVYASSVHGAALIRGTHSTTLGNPGISEVKDNILIFDGATAPTYIIDIADASVTIKDIVISGNYITGTDIGIRAASGVEIVTASGISILNNIIRPGTKGITFRLCHNIIIQGNVIEGASELVCAIEMGYQTTNWTGLIIQGNIIKNSAEGIGDNGGTGRYGSFYGGATHNSFVDVTTAVATTKLDA